MTIDKALEILNLRALAYRKTNFPDRVAAIQLSIEALKRCKARSDRFPNLPHLRLPGETPSPANSLSEEELKRLQESPLGRQPGA